MEVIDLFTYRYKPSFGDVVIDLGSGLGTELEFFSKSVGPNGRVLAIEADPDLYQLNLALVEQSNLSNVSCYNIAIHYEAGFVDLGVRSSDGIDSSIHMIDPPRRKRIEAITLDSFLEREEIVSVDYIKINIEGSEREALMGANRYLTKIANWCISTHDFCGMPTMDFVQTFLANNGMCYEVQKDDPMRPWEGGYVYAWW